MPRYCTSIRTTRICITGTDIDGACGAGNRLALDQMMPVQKSPPADATTWFCFALPGQGNAPMSGQEPGMAGRPVGHVAARAAVAAVLSPTPSAVTTASIWNTPIPTNTLAGVPMSISKPKLNGPNAKPTSSPE